MSVNPNEREIALSPGSELPGESLMESLFSDSLAATNGVATQASTTTPTDLGPISTTTANYLALKESYIRLRRAARKFAQSEGNYFRVIVCGSNRIQPDSRYYRDMSRYGELLKAHNIDLGTGVGYGAMEAVSIGHQSVNSSMAQLFGVPMVLPGERLDSYAYTDYRAFPADDFHARLIMMDAIGTLWVISPGAVGTMLEFLYVKQHIQFLLKDFTLDQARHVILKNQGVHLGYLPRILLYNPLDNSGRGFFDNYLRQIDVFVREGMLSDKEAAGVLPLNSIEELIASTLEERERWRDALKTAGIDPRN